MNVGTDYTFSLYDATRGRLIDLGDVQDIKITREVHDIANRPYNKDPSFGYVPDGYSISGSITRTGPALENLMIANEALFRSGGVTQSGFLQESVTEADGTVSRYQYSGVVITIPDLGTITREKQVVMSLKGKASKKVIIA